MKKILKKYYLFRIKKLMKRMRWLESPENFFTYPSPIAPKGLVFQGRGSAIRSTREQLALYNHKTKLVS